MIDQLHHRLHRVLDDQHGNPVRPQLPDDRQNIIEVVVCEPGERLVEQHQPGMRDQGACQLHQPQFPGGQAAGDSARLRAQPDPVERGQRHLARGRIIGGADESTDDDVFEHRHARKGAHDLKGASDPAAADLVGPQAGDRLAGEAYRAAIGGEKPVDDVEQRRLAGAVRADDAVEPALGKGEVDPVQRAQPAERDPDIAQHQKIGAG